MAFDTSINSTLRGWWLDILAATDAIIKPKFAKVEASDSKRQLTIKQMQTYLTSVGSSAFQGSQSKYIMDNDHPRDGIYNQ